MLKGKIAGQEAKQDARERLDDVKAKLDAAQARLEEAKKLRNKQWEELRATIEGAWKQGGSRFQEALRVRKLDPQIDRWHAGQCRRRHLLLPGSQPEAAVDCDCALASAENHHRVKVELGDLRHRLDQGADAQDCPHQRVAIGWQRPAIPVQ